MIRDVDLVSYLPTFMKEYKEPVLALEAENPEFTLVWNAKEQVLYNRFIETADEYGISRFESMLGLHPTSEDTLESRRSRVRSIWFNTIPFTVVTLIQKLIVLCGSESDFTLTHDFDEGYTLSISVDLEIYGQVEELERIIDVMTPCNIVYDVQNIFNLSSSGSSCVGGCIGWVDDVNITPDFNEENNINGDSKIASVISRCDVVNITPDFIEQNEINGSSNVTVALTVAEISNVESEE